MTDCVDSETRSRMMAGIRGADTRPELLVRRALHARGFRFRLHARYLPGRPDLVLAKYRAAVFVHGCFWHRHAGCRYATEPGTRVEFWEAKFAANMLRDDAVAGALRAAGWRVATVWECALKRPEAAGAAIEALAAWLPSAAGEIEIGADNP